MLTEGLDTPPVPDHPNALGRIYLPDDRDNAFPMAAALPDGKLRGWRHWWADGWWGDQQDTSQCVAYAWTHWLEDGPRTIAPFAPQRTAQHGTGAAVDPDEVYHEAQSVDEWDGEDYDGTSVRAGAKVLASKGHISEYRWAQRLDDIVQALLTTGPVIMGTTWYSGMSEPDGSGWCRPVGDYMGGHAYVLDGVNTDARFFRIKNSWGREWGKSGFARISFDDAAALLEDSGEACLALPALEPVRADD